MRRLLSGVCVLAVIAGSFSGCSRSPSAAASQSEADAASASASTRTALATLYLTYDKPAVVGASVHATATGLPPANTVDLAWGTVDGGWVIEDYYHFRGKKYSGTTTSLPSSAANRSLRTVSA